MVREVRKVIEHIRADPTRGHSRMWAGKRRGEERLGHTYVFEPATCERSTTEDGTEQLVVRGSSATIKQILARIKPLVE
jgi:hypothetical protein